MRYVDIYREDTASGSGFALVVQDCIQIENANVTRKSTAKSFTMADGTLCLYPSEKDSAEFTLSLECSGSQASKISAAVRLGELYFAGMRVGSTASLSPADSSYLHNSTFSAFTGHFPENSSIQVKEIEAAADLYSVQIPMKLQLSSSGKYLLTSVPFIRADSISVLGAEENFNAYRYRKGAFCRSAVLFTSQASVSFSFNMAQSVLDNFDIFAKLGKEAVTVQLWSNTGTEGYESMIAGNNSCTASLSDGRNDFVFRIWAQQFHKDFVLKFTVWKNPEVISS